MVGFGEQRCLRALSVKARPAWLLLDHVILIFRLLLMLIQLTRVYLAVVDVSAGSGPGEAGSG